MLFTSFTFPVFLIIVFVLYWFVTQRHLKLQNAMLLIASYVFYGWWDYRFLGLIVLSSVIDYIAAIHIGKSVKRVHARMWFALSLCGNLGMLFFFKYFGFFAASFAAAFSSLGIHLEHSSLNIILPVGISFYTFQTMSYTIDVFRGRMKPSKDIVGFLAYVSFFPQLVAGPIERASNLLPQFEKKRSFDYATAVDGLRQILWGLVKKVVVADNCATLANQIFSDYSQYGSGTLVLGLIFFAFQIYGDFSGYSDIAVGVAKLFGFKLMRNFANPYFSRNIAEFWSRWHISLSTWFRDYVYIPLGGSKKGKLMHWRNIMIVFVVSGLWHGANWTYVFWGFLNAMYFYLFILFGYNRHFERVVAAGKLLPNLKELGLVVLTFSLTVFAWTFFRAPTMHVAFQYLFLIVNSYSGSLSIPYNDLLPVIGFVVFLIIVDWIHREYEHGLSPILHSRHWIQRLMRFGWYLALAVLIILSSPNEAKSFIYFQF